VRRGEIWWGAPPLPGGSQKRRPFLVVSVDAFNRNERYPKVMVVHLTTALRAGEPFRWEIEVPRGTAGLPAASVVKCNEVYTLLKTHLTAIAGTLPRPYVDRVDRALALTLGLAISL
jgi:mRNA-degrading endonuclease toxin of MazEF toxin-antitoxin module